MTPHHTCSVHVAARCLLRISFNGVGGLEAAWDRACAVVRAEGTEADDDAEDVD